MVLDSSLTWTISTRLRPSPTVSSIKVALAIAVQNDWPLYHFDVGKFLFTQNSTPTFI